MNPKQYEVVIEADGNTEMYETNIKISGKNFKIMFSFELDKNFIDVGFPEEPFCITWQTKDETTSAHILPNRQWFYEKELNDAVDEVVGKNKLKFEYEYNQITVTCLDPEIKSLCLGNTGLQWAKLRSPFDFTKQSTYTFQISNLNNSINIKTNFTDEIIRCYGCYYSDLPKIKCCDSKPISVNIPSDNPTLKFQMFPYLSSYPFKYKGLLKVKCQLIYND